MPVRFRVAVLFVAVGLSGASQTQHEIRLGFGAIQGQVIDAQTGQPVAKAKVLARSDDAGSARILPSVLSDDNGNFFLNDISPGRYVIPASKEDAYYPDTDAAALAGDMTVLPKIVVKEGEITGNVVIRIEKGAVLLGRILDAATHQPIAAAKIRLIRADHPAWWLLSAPDLNGHFRFVVPSRPFRVEVSAPGYRMWRYSGSQGDILLLKKESQESVTIMLDKD
jgi:5-hydroxyisourate hydrolase-like protein (transthyretin family)